ncbi:MAG: TMEM165/GDT1 family protein [Deltaproteobacteria bacterium]|nr:TMEM165/GDT1 family protein [Deltaproteobacteria bacterium]
MDLSTFASAFGLIFLAELGDKTQLTAMALAARYPWKKVFLGIAAAFTVLNLAAVSAGKVLFLVMPARWVYGASGLLFLFFGILTLWARKNGGEEEGRVAVGGPILAPFLLILLAELGDKTQLATAGLAAQSPDAAAVFAGSTLALWTVSLLGILLGRQLTRLVPLSTVHKGAGAVFLLFGALALRQAFLAG